jgi:hypothetical protein
MEKSITVLIPGRHHLLTDFQFKYLYKLVQLGLEHEPDVDGSSLGFPAPVGKLVFAVTSANHANTRRNPIPFHLRAMAIMDFAQELGIPSYVFPIDDIGKSDDFAAYTIKKIRHESEGLVDMNPDNTVVLCSSPVLTMYEEMGFKILPAELEKRGLLRSGVKTPWELVESIAKAPGDWRRDPLVFQYMHQASYLLWSRYGLGEKVKRLMEDDMISADGDLTLTRDYNTYVREMDEIAEMKYRETAPFIRPGRIGDIGCAVGSWIKLACGEEKFRESDFFGIEVARQFYQICNQRKENGEFANQNVFFAQKNAVTGLCFAANSMNTIHTSSLTHEIESYGSHADLLSFIANRYSELAPGGVWVNRDVVGPENGDETVWVWANPLDGRTEDWETKIEERKELQAYLEGLSTLTLLKRFERDFRHKEGDGVSFEWVEHHGATYVRTSLRDAMEFISKKDYCENWLSEMHEKFCFWSFSDWKSGLENAGYVIESNSRAYTNEWLVRNRYEGKVALYRMVGNDLEARPWPQTHMLMVAGKRL